MKKILAVLLCLVLMRLWGCVMPVTEITLPTETTVPEEQYPKCFGKTASFGGAVQSTVSLPSKFARSVPEEVVETARWTKPSPARIS